MCELVVEHEVDRERFFFLWFSFDISNIFVVPFSLGKCDTFSFCCLFVEKCRFAYCFQIFAIHDVWRVARQDKPTYARTEGGR